MAQRTGVASFYLSKEAKLFVSKLARRHKMSASRIVDALILAEQKRHARRVAA